MSDHNVKQAITSAFLDTVREAIAGFDYASREAALELFDQIEAQLVELVSIPAERLPRAQRALEAQLIGLLELGRLEALRARRDLVLGGIRVGLDLARALILKL